MNNFNIVYDNNGKEYSAIYDEEDDDKIFGNSNLEDFEIINKLGSGGFGDVFKVCFHKNSRIYAMKVIDLTKEEKARKYNLNEIKFLEKLSHAHIIKYYKNIHIKEKIYMILEYINNGSIDDLINSYKKINMTLPEELIWNLLLQCYSGLTYLHQKGVVHRDIKPENLLLDNNMTLKIGDFGTSGLYTNLGLFDNYDNMKCDNTFIGTLPFMAPEVKKQMDYNEKLDIYSMGVTFYKICYLEGSKEKINEYYMKKASYSRELNDIINLMLEENMNKRKSSKDIFEMIKEEYSKKYNKISSIDSLIRCLFSFEALTEYFLSIENINANLPITNAYIECLKAARHIDKNIWMKSISNIRKLLGQEYTKLEGNKEVEPKFIFAFLVKYLHKELNKPIINNNNNYGNKNNHLCFKEYSETSKLDMLNEFLKNFLGKVNSNISNCFMGLMKEIKICNKCKLKTYQFKSYFFVIFDLEKIIKNNGNIKSINIEDNFSYHNKEKTIKENFCYKCHKNLPHYFHNFFYSSPNMLIISIQRGVSHECKIPIIIKPELDISNYVEFKYLKTKYNLVGIIKRGIKNGNEYYFSNIYVDEIWFRCEGKNIKKIEFPSSDSEGDIIMLFYEAV